MSVCVRVFVCALTKNLCGFCVCIYTHTGLHVHIYTVLCPPREFLIFGAFFLGCYEFMNVCVCACLCVCLQTYLCGPYVFARAYLYCPLPAPGLSLIFETFLGCMTV